MSSQTSASSHDERTLALVQKLAAAIQSGENDQATNLVVELTNRRLKLDISVPTEDFETRSKEKEFSVKVHVEDRESQGCIVNLMVKSCDTIADLKRQMMLKHDFPMEVQRWIIGQRIYEDKYKLSQCGVKSSGHTLYLYLVTARSVGLSRQQYDANKQQMLSLNSNHGSWLANAVENPPTSYYLQQNHPSNQPNMINSDGSGRIQELHHHQMLASVANQLQGPVVSVGGKSGNINVNAPLSSCDSSRPASPEPEEKAIVGWECPRCTFINMPLRPGCELCSCDRPDNYNIPAGYQPTESEQLLIQNEQQLERLTRENTNQTQQSGGITQEALRESLRLHSLHLQAALRDHSADVPDTNQTVHNLDFLKFSEPQHRDTTSLASMNRSASRHQTLQPQGGNQLNLPGFDQILPSYDSAPFVSDEEN